MTIRAQTLMTVEDYRRAAISLVPPWVSVSVKVDVFGRQVLSQSREGNVIRTYAATSGRIPTVVVSLGGRRIYRALLKQSGRDEVAARVSTLAERIPVGCELEVRWT